MNTNLVGLGVVIAVVVIVLIALILRRPKKRPVSRSQMDAMTLAQLRKAGSDLGRPHSVEFFLYFRERNGAVKAADSMDRLGYDASVQQAEGKGSWTWLCFGTKQIVPTIENIDRCRSQLEGIARQYHGEYDGWGTPVERSH